MNSLDSNINKIAKNMKRYLLSILTLLSVNLYALDCPADSAYHTDLRTLLPNGSPNPTFNNVDTPPSPVIPTLTKITI